jgi:hypothetical protein
VPISVSDVVIEVYQNATVEVTDLGVIEGQNITITVNGVTKEVTVNNTKANATFVGLAAGNYTIVVKYAGDDYRNANESNATLTVTQITPAINIDIDEIHVGQTSEITVTLDERATGAIVVEVNGNKYYETLERGSATVRIAGLANGTYPVNVNYLGDRNFTANSNSSSLIVSKNNYTITISGVDTVEGQYAVFLIDGPDVIDGKVVVEVGGTIYFGDMTFGIASVTVSI